MGRRSARRHHQFFAWVSVVGSIDCRGARRRTNRWDGLSCSGASPIHGMARRWCLVRWRPTARLNRDGSWAGADRDRFSIQDTGRLGGVPGSAEANSTRHGRRASRWVSGDRSRNGGSRSVRRFLGADARAMGQGGGDRPDSRGGWCDHRSAGRTGDGPARRRGRRESGDA